MSEDVTLQKALAAIQKLKKLLAEKKQQESEPIAIIGIGCRFPNVANKDEYWDLLIQGKNVITPVPEERWELLRNTNEMHLYNSNHRYLGGYLKQIDFFDTYFFGVSPREAVRMDPQQRILLEVCYEALEDAGLTLEQLAGSNTGVFASLYSSQYGLMQTIDSDMDALYIPTGNALSIAANRLSYLLDLKGPSVVLDTACSSSLVALHIACLNLQNKVCDTAIVCAANINLLPSINLILARAKMLSPDGQCKTFDADANGYVQGEGVTTIVLKPLSKAIFDQDRIYAVIRGCEVNQDGKTNGLTAPNGLQQAELFRSLYRSTGISPAKVSYIECHGTGTFLGDPIEVEALGQVFGQHRDEHNPCWIGSVKTNIGHLEPAAGLASIIKAALSLKNGKIPPHLNVKNPNPLIPFDRYHLKIPLQAIDWAGKERICGVSGFGFGGTNAHAILHSFDDALNHEVPIKRSVELFTLSAKEPSALIEMIKRWRDFLLKHPDINLAQLCYNLHVRRTHYSNRLVILIQDRNELLNALNALHENQNLKNDQIYSLLNGTQSEALSTDPIRQIAQRYVANETIDWKDIEKDRKFPMQDMPFYPWQRKSYWANMSHLVLKDQAHQYPLQGIQVKSPIHHIYEFTFDVKALQELMDTFNVVHLGFYFEMLGFAVKQMGGKSFVANDIHFISALIIPDNQAITVQLIIEKNSHHFKFYSLREETWVEHCYGQLEIQNLETVQTYSAADFKNKAAQHGHAEAIYEKVTSMNMPTGDSIRWSRYYWCLENEILCQFQFPTCNKEHGKFALMIHPGVFDGSVQPIFYLLKDDNKNSYMASEVQAFRYFGVSYNSLHLLCRLIDSEDLEKIRGSCYLLNENNQMVAEIAGITLTQLKQAIKMQPLKNQPIIDVAKLSNEECYRFVHLFLKEQIATILSMPINDIKMDAPLNELGIDSLMALVLVQALERQFKLSYSADKILRGVTLSSIEQYILDSVSTPLRVANSDTWISFREKQTQPKLRLFCFPYGGGGASIYRNWQHNFPDLIEVCPVQLPGRENRMDETAISEMPVLIDALINALQYEFDLPFAFFGHSFGALIAFELSRELRKLGLAQPQHLFLSAFPDPRTPTKNLDKIIEHLKTIEIDFKNLQDPQFLMELDDLKLKEVSEVFKIHGILEYGDSLLNRNILKVVMPIFTSDMSLVKSYQFHKEAPLNIPLSIFVGNNDTWVDKNDFVGWNEHTTKTCQFHYFEAEHLFIREDETRKRMLQMIIDELSRVDKNVIPAQAGI